QGPAAVEIRVVNLVHGASRGIHIIEQNGHRRLIVHSQQIHRVVPYLIELNLEILVEFRETAVGDGKGERLVRSAGTPVWKSQGAFGQDKIGISPAKHIVGGRRGHGVVGTRLEREKGIVF